jgi:hypothetical protein
MRQGLSKRSHPGLYMAVMEVVGFTEETLSFLVNNKAEGVNLVGMGEARDSLAQDLSGKALLLVLDFSLMVMLDDVICFGCS